MSDYFQTQLDLHRNSILLDISSSLDEANWLQRQTLSVAESNLDVNIKKFHATKRNAFLLQEVNESLQLGFKGLSRQIGYLGLQLEKFSDIVSQKIWNEEHENFVRDIIFNLKKIDESLSKKSDKKYIALEAKELLSQIDFFKIDSQCFTQIQDKEYFSSTLESIQAKYDAISDDEKKEIEIFSYVYFSVKAGLKKLEEIEKIKLINFPEKIEGKEKPESNEILELKEYLLNEIRNPAKVLGIIPGGAQKYLTKFEELPDLFEKYFAELKKYEIQLLDFNQNQELYKYQEKSRKYGDFIAALKKCLISANKYIEENPAFEESYPRFELNIEEKIADYRVLLEEHAKQQKALEKKLDEFYLKNTELLNKKMFASAGIQSDAKERMNMQIYLKKQRQKKLVFIIILGVIILISILVYKFSV